MNGKRLVGAICFPRFSLLSISPVAALMSPMTIGIVQSRFVLKLMALRKSANMRSVEGRSLQYTLPQKFCRFRVYLSKADIANISPSSLFQTKPERALHKRKKKKLPRQTYQVWAKCLRWNMWWNRWFRVALLHVASRIFSEYYSGWYANSWNVMNFFS